MRVVMKGFSQFINLEISGHQTRIFLAGHVEILAPCTQINFIILTCYEESFCTELWHYVIRPKYFCQKKSPLAIMCWLSDWMLKPHCLSDAFSEISKLSISMQRSAKRSLQL